jgi:hypothetical protein
MVSASTRLVEEFWAKLQSRDWVSLQGMLTENFQATFPQSGEVFDRSSYILINRSYPGEWSIAPPDLFDCGEWILAKAQIEIDGRIDHAFSFFRTKDGSICELHEYWAEPFPAPEWRVRLMESAVT